MPLADYRNQRDSPVSLYKTISRCLAIIVALIALVVLVGWSLNIAALKSVLPNLISMKPNTAICFFLIGACLWLLRIEHVHTRGQNAARTIVVALAAIVILIGLATILEYGFDWNLGIDQLLFREEAGAVGTTHPGRMAPNTALNFIIIGMALVLIDMRNRKGYRPAQYLMLFSGVISLAALLGYVYGVPRFYGPLSSFTAMALHTAGAFILVFLALFLARPEHGIMKVIAGRLPGSFLLRRIGPIAIGTTILLGWVRLLGERAGWYDTPTGTALYAACTIFVFTFALFLISRRLNKKEVERKKADDEIKKYNIELTALNKELEAFSYSASHDLRAPLRGIDGFSQALLEDYSDKLDERGKDYLRRVRSATQRMGELIDALLSLSRMTRQEMHLQMVDLSDAVQRIATELQKKQAERRVDWIIAEGVTAEGDSRLLNVVMENLLRNAWKYASKCPRARIEFGTTQAAGETAYFVKDNGAGFDMAYKDKLFSPFQRLHAGSEFHGSGIGLATVQRIIHRHGGRVWAEGEVDRGAIFYFTLPLTKRGG